MSEETLNEAVQDVIDDASVMTVPIDDTLTVSGEAADAKAVGDALALKADKSEIATSVSVNGQTADAQGLILVSAENVPLTDSSSVNVKSALDSLDAKTGAEIMLNSTTGAGTIESAIADAGSRTADEIRMTGSTSKTVYTALNEFDATLSELQETVEGLDEKTAEDILYESGGSDSVKDVVDALSGETVKSVNEVLPDTNGNVTIEKVDYADNLWSDDGQQVDDTFLRRTTAGSGSVSDGDAWVLNVQGNRVHSGYTAESLNMTVIPMPRTAPAAITATLDESAFLAVVTEAGTYDFSYTDGWSQDPEDYGITVANDPIDGDLISVYWDGASSPVMTVTAAARTAPAPITATIDRDVFVAYVDSSGTYDLYYTTDWSEDPANYGITVTNDPVSGDQIRVVYVKEVRGTITQGTPTALVGTGWNLYESANGYARVTYYSASYGYRVGGIWTALSFSETLTGTRETITPNASGLFTVPGDGYVFVTGGDSTSTYILTTWSDWTGGYSGSWEAYTESSVDISGIMSTYFPYGLCCVGDVRDEIDFNARTTTRRINRMAYTAANLETAKNSGQEYEYDENYIYIVLASEVTGTFSLDNAYTVCEHGLEFFDGSEVALYAEILYGQNLKDKLKRLNAAMIPRTEANSQTVEEKLAALDTALTSETSTRTSADTTLRNSITSEATTRASADSSLSEAIAKLETLVVTVTMTGTGSSVTASVSNSSIETDMVIVNSVLSNPAAVLSDITWSTATAGVLSLTGTINGTTTVACYLTKSR